MSHTTRFLTAAAVATACAIAASTLARADVTTFFAPCQVKTPVSSGVTSDTISSNGIIFTYTRDKLFTGGTGQVIGRQERVPWPAGVEAQAVTTPPPGSTDYHAHLDIKRADGALFDLPSFTVKLLANTAGAGAMLEIMPQLNGEDAFADPLYFDVTGYYGQTFSYDTSPNPWGSTAQLVGYEMYKVTLWTDFAFVALSLNSAAPGPQSCCLPDLSCADVVAATCLPLGGLPGGDGTSCPCTTCTPLPPPAPPPVPDGTAPTQPLLVFDYGWPEPLTVTWDAASCPAVNYNLVYGDLASVASYAVGGAVCALGTAGSFDWTGVPAGSLWFVVVGTDAVATESSWGLDWTGLERGGAAASGQCGVSAKSVIATCP